MTFTFYALNLGGQIIGSCEAHDKLLATALLEAMHPTLAAVQSKASYELGRDRPRPRLNNDDEQDGS